MAKKPRVGEGLGPTKVPRTAAGGYRPGTRPRAKTPTAARVFDDILLQGVRNGQMPARTTGARKWFRAKAKELGKVQESTILRQDKSRLKDAQKFKIGSMYFFMYDAKHKGTLPYFDRFPLIFPVGQAKGGFYGCNMHYLPLPLRAKLMDALYETANNDKYDESTKLQINYGILKHAEKFKAFQPTFKHYLFSQVRSRLVYVNPSEWDIALFLNVAQFQGASQQKIWADSRKIINGK